MKNRYEIDGDSVRVFLPRKTGPDLVMLIDLADLGFALSIEGTIYASWNNRSRSFVVYFHESAGGTQKTISFRRRLLGCSSTDLVDHVNHDGLDNRRSNIRIVTQAVADLNRRGPARTNKTSGVRGVHLHKKSGRWRAQIGVNGKLLSLGLFASKEEAKDAFNRALLDIDPESSIS